MMTAKQDYGIRVRVAYENFRKGQVIFPPAMLREALVKRGFCERLYAPQAAEPEAKAAAEVPKMVDTLRRRRAK